MKYRKILILFMVIIMASVGIGCTKKDAINTQTTKNVKTIKAVLSEITIEDQFAGEINSLNQTGVVPKVPGKVAQILADVGTKVNKGDVLFILDSSDAQTQLQQAEAGVELAKVNLSRAQGSGYSQSLIQAKSAVEQSRISFDETQRNYNSIKSLYDQGAASKNDLEAIENRLKAAKQAHEDATRNLDLLNKGLAPDSIELAQAQLKQANAALELIKLQINNAKVTAPIDGVISKKNINIGEMASAAAPAMIISGTNKMIAEISVPEKLVNKLELNQKVSVTVDSIASSTFEAEIISISPASDQKTFNYTVKINILNPSNDIKIGMFAKVRLPIEKKSNVLVVPNETIISENGLQYVFAVENNKIVKKIVSLGLSNNKDSEIVQGLKEGDNIIFEGQSFINEGETVSIVS